MTGDKEEKEKKPTATPGLVFSDVMFEQAADGMFIVYDRVSGQISTRTLIVRDADSYVPLTCTPWRFTACLPTVQETDDPLTKEELVEKLKARRFNGEYGDSERLFYELREFFEMHLDVSNALYFDAYAAWVLVTYRSEDFNVISYLAWLGPPGSGKTRGLEVLEALAFRAIASPSVSSAIIYRVLEKWHPTLLLDETEIYSAEDKAEVVAILNSGYRKGQRVMRMVQVKGEEPEIGFFDVFGCKALASTKEFVATLQSRNIITKMTRNVRHVNLFVDEEKAQELRNKLLLYRFRNLGMSLDYNVDMLNGQFTNSRVIELFVGLLQVAPNEEIRNRLIELMRQVTKTRLDAEQVSIPAQVFEAILNCEDKVEGGKLSTKTVTEHFNLGKNENEQVKTYWMGRQVSALGFEECRLSHGIRGFYWNKELVERLNARYFPKGTPETPSQTSLLSQTSPDMETQHTPETPEGDRSDRSHSIQDSEPVQNNVKGDISDASDGSDSVLEIPPRQSGDVLNE